MQVKVKKLHPDAKLPEYATPGAACFDLRAVNVRGMTAADAEVLRRQGVFARTVQSLHGGEGMVFGTGLAFEIPHGYAMLIFSRSGHGFNENVRLANCVGVIDSDYRGEVMVKLRNDSSEDEFDWIDVKHDDRIAQAMILPIPQIELIEVDELSDTERGEGGLGHTGQN